MAEQRVRSRGWCYTANVQEFIPQGDLNERCIANAGPPRKYQCWQEEVAPTTGQKHYQGFVYFMNPVMFNSVKTYLNEVYGVQCHIEKAKGSPAQNKEYCSKPGGTNFTEHGVCPEQGARGDLAEIGKRLAAGDTLLDVAESFPSDFIRYHGGIKAFQLITHSKARNSAVDPIVYWWFGPTGVGKSRKAFEEFGAQAYVKMNDKWWDGYIGQPVVIMDDYRPSLMPFNEFLRCIDRYPYRVQPKGGSIELSATTFVITSCGRPEDLWHGRTDEQLGQLLRRITEIVEFAKDPAGTVVEYVLKSDVHNIQYVPLTRAELDERHPQVQQMMN